MTPSTTPARDEACDHVWSPPAATGRYCMLCDEPMPLTAPAPASGRVDAVAVKPLEWSEPDAGGMRTAYTALGTASLWLRSVNEWRWELGSVAAGWERTYADALKVLTATYEGRIRSALSPAAASGSEATCQQSLQVQSIPRAENTGRCLAETNDGRLLYLNHANEWQEMPNILAKPSSPAGEDKLANLVERFSGAVISRKQMERLRADVMPSEGQPAEFVKEAIDAAIGTLEAAGFSPDIESAEPGNALLAYLGSVRDNMPDGPDLRPVQAPSPAGVREAAAQIIASRSSTYKARNGRVMGIEDDSGEMMWIVPFDDMAAIEAALSPSTSAAPAGEVEEQRVDCERCQGNGEIVADWDRYLHGEDGDKGYEGTAECPDCDGIGTVPAHPAPAAVEADQAWRELCERDDRTSPEEYPDMCLITRDELAEFICRTAHPAPATVEMVREALKPFADIANGYADQEDDDFQVWKDFDVLGATLPLRIFRRAQTAYQQLAALSPATEGRS